MKVTNCSGGAAPGAPAAAGGAETEEVGSLPSLAMFFYLLIFLSWYNFLYSFFPHAPN